MCGYVAHIHMCGYVTRIHTRMYVWLCGTHTYDGVTWCMCGYVAHIHTMVYVWLCGTHTYECRFFAPVDAYVLCMSLCLWYFGVVYGVIIKRVLLPYMG